VSGKRRVHELAKEFGVTSKVILAELREAGEIVKSASSTIEAPVVRRLREAHGAKPQRPKAQTAEAPPRKATKPVAEKKLARRQGLTRSQIAALCDRYRAAAASENPSQSVKQFYLNCEATYGLSRMRVDRFIAADKHSHPHKYLPLQNRRDSSADAPSANPMDARTVLVKPQVIGPTLTPADPNKSRTVRPRVRTATLPPITAAVDWAAVAAMIAGTANQPREAVEACLQEIVPTETGDYGYLFWRYSGVRRAAHPGSDTATAVQDLAALADLIDLEKHLMQALERAHGAIFDDSELAKRALDNRFEQLTSDDDDDLGRHLESYQRRRTSARFDFLRRAVVLAIARPSNDEHLWNMLADLQPYTNVETAPDLKRANQRLADFIASTDRLLATDDVALTRFLRRSRAELLALRSGRYDFLISFRDIATARQTPAELAFELLPPGEQTQKFLHEIRKSGRYLGHHIDERRLDVLEQLQAHFTSARCRLHKGSRTSSGVDSRYLVLVIKSVGGASEDAVAISPLAGLHATYVVRRECADADWPVIFAGPKPEARRQGARKLLFVGNGNADPYSTMHNKVINLLECDRVDFPDRHR
jgi:hypothetical protein